MTLYDPDNPPARLDHCRGVMRRYTARLAAMTDTERAQHYADAPRRWREACGRAGVVSRV